MEGYRRKRSVVDSRIPIMYNSLRDIYYILPRVCISEYEAILFQAVYTLAFFGLFRVGELVVGYGHSCHALQQADIKVQIKVNLTKSERRLMVCLRKSKTNQSGKPLLIPVPEMEGQICAVKAVHGG